MARPNPAQASGAFGTFQPPETKKRQMRLYILLGALFVIIAAAGYYFLTTYGFTTLQVSSDIPPVQELNAVELKVIRLSSFNFDVVDSVPYKALKLYGDIPIKVEALGRVNPLAPF